MTYYTLHNKDGTKQTHFCASKEHLINEIFDGDVSKYKEQVQSMQWTSLGMSITEQADTGSLQRSITGADVNPYGWRG